MAEGKSSKGGAILSSYDYHRLGYTGYLIYLRETFQWLADNVGLIAPHALCTSDGAPKVDVHIPWDGPPTFEVCYEAFLGEQPTMGDEVKIHDDVAAWLDGGCK